jgi:hypothetical protein
MSMSDLQSVETAQVGPFWKSSIDFVVVKISVGFKEPRKGVSKSLTTPGVLP